MATTFRLTHSTSGHKEEVTQDTIDALKKAGLLKHYTVSEVVPVKRPSEYLSDDLPAPATPKTPKTPKATTGS